MSRTDHGWPSDKVEVLRELRRSGISYAGCAKFLEVSRSAIAGQIDRRDLDKRVNPTPSAAARRLAEFDPLIRRLIDETT